LEDHLQGAKGQASRKEIFYFDDSGSLNAFRYGDWKVTFATKDSWWTDVAKPRTVPLVINLRQDPFEVTMDSKMYTRWFADNMWLFLPIGQKVKGFLATIPQYPFQAGEVLQPSDINYKTLTVVGALKKMQEVQLQIANPQN
jgi:arylsulfatase